MWGISRRSFLLATAGLAVASRHVAEGAASDLTFLAIGDWGRGSDAQRKVAVQMAKTAEAIGPRFVISTGDNFYTDGVKSVDDAQWVTSFENVYDAPALMMPWYITLGNHDHRGNISAQVAYTKLSSRWRLPANYYKHTQLLAEGKSVVFFHIDTTPIIERYPSEDPQLVWLERKLAASTAIWKIVIGHHPVYAGGEHGETRELIVLLKPLLDRYGVQVYLNGHDHDMEHVVVGGTHYLTSGAAGRPKHAKAIEGTQFVMGDRLGFMMARLTPNVMHIEFIDAQGTSLYHARIPQTPTLSYWGAVWSTLGWQDGIGQRSN
jgi:tartrate-resistant acid phosphatase type 5